MAANATPHRICIAGRSPFVGGAEIAAERLALGLADAGASPWLLLGCDGPVAERARHADIEHAITPVDPIGRGNWFAWRRRVSAITRLLRQRGADSVHVNDLPTARTVAAAARPLGIPVVVHHRFIYGQAAIDWFNATPPAHHVYVSAALRRELAAASPRLADQPAVVLHDGLPLDTPAPDAAARAAARDTLDLPQDAAVVVFTGQVIERKGVADLIDAWAALDADTRRRARLVIVGDDIAGNGAYRRAMEQRAEQLGIAPRFEGFVTDTTPYLVAADLAAVPSHVEPLGNATLEAMRAGLPVVATRVGGIPEMVDHPITGLLGPPRDPATLANHLAELIESRALRASLGTAARDRCENLFSLPRHAQDVLDLHARLVAGETPAHAPADSATPTPQALPLGRRSASSPQPPARRAA
ncbi:MAG: glycosyltransferase family 4 protein [Planctomycetota bacterium]